MRSWLDSEITTNTPVRSASSGVPTGAEFTRFYTITGITSLTYLYSESEFLGVIYGAKCFTGADVLQKHCTCAARATRKTGEDLYRVQKLRDPTWALHLVLLKLPSL